MAGDSEPDPHLPAPVHAGDGSAGGRRAREVQLHVAAEVGGWSRGPAHRERQGRAAPPARPRPRRSPAREALAGTIEASSTPPRWGRCRQGCPRFLVRMRRLLRLGMKSTLANPTSYEVRQPPATTDRSRIAGASTGTSNGHTARSRLPDDEDPVTTPDRSAPPGQTPLRGGCSTLPITHSRTSVGSRPWSPPRPAVWLRVVGRSRC